MNGFFDFKGFYDTMDVGYKCDNGFITVLSRADNVINVAGHRISSAAIEEVNHTNKSKYFFKIQNHKLVNTIKHSIN